MAAKMAARTAMVTMLGQDSFGKDTLENYKRHGIDSTHVLFTSEAATGVAPIAVDQSGLLSVDIRVLFLFFFSVVLFVCFDCCSIRVFPSSISKFIQAKTRSSS